MAVKQLPTGKWEADVQRHGMKRARRKFDTEQRALDFEDKYIRDNAPDFTVSDTRKLSELVRLWMDYHGYTLADGAANERALLALCRDLNNPIGELLTQEAVVQLRAKRLQHHKPVTWNNHLALLKNVFNRLKKLKVINFDNPVADIDAIKVHETQLAYLSKGEIERLMVEIQDRGVNKSTWWVAQICIRTGARWGEAEQLRAKQVRDGRITYEYTKGKRVRTIPVDKVFYAALVKFVAGKGANDRVFENCEKAFRHAVGRAEIELPDGQMTHICRHTYASHFVMKGGDILMLQKILGHTDIKMTMRYAHLAPNYLDDAVKFAPI